MKVFGERQRIAVTAAAAGVMLALSACTPAGTGAGGQSSADAASTARSTAQSTATAPPSPSAAPGTSATVGAVVSGFPEVLLPLMPGAKVVSSSFDKTSVPATAAVVGSIAAPTADVLAFYAQALEAQGFTPVPGDSVGDVPSKDFLRGDNETVNIAVVESAGVATFTIGANVAAESIK